MSNHTFKPGEVVTNGIGNFTVIDGADIPPDHLVVKAEDGRVSVVRDSSYFKPVAQYKVGDWFLYRGRTPYVITSTEGHLHTLIAQDDSGYVERSDFTLGYARSSWVPMPVAPRFEPGDKIEGRLSGVRHTVTGFMPDGQSYTTDSESAPSVRIRAQGNFELVEETIEVGDTVNVTCKPTEMYYKVVHLFTLKNIDMAVIQGHGLTVWRVDELTLPGPVELASPAGWDE